METATYILIDAINSSGIDNSLWGCSTGIDSTRRYFGTIENVAIERMFIYVFRDENYESFIPKIVPSLTLHIEQVWGTGVIDIYYI